MKKKGTNFEKFYKGGEKTGAAKKEQLRQERKQFKKERKEFFEQKRAENRQAFEAKDGQGKPAAAKTITRETPTGEMPLNKYLAHSGVCSRRDAADVVRSGKVKVNGEVVT